MDIETVFVVDKNNKMLIFLGVLKEGISLNQEQLGKVLGAIAAKTSELDINATEGLQISDKLYLFGNFEKIIIIIGVGGTDIPQGEFVIELYKRFSQKYAQILENYSNNDIPKFKTFLDDIKDIISGHKKPDLAPTLEPVSASAKPNATTQEMSTPSPPKEQEIGSVPLIKPMERDAYPEGIPEYKRDEVFWNETEMIKADYVAEFVEGLISQLKIFLSISLTHHYEIFIDFSDYPNKPKISIGSGLAKELGKNLDDLLYYYRNWDTKMPPHIVEIIREFETVLMKYKVKGNLSDTSEMPEAALPELEPLPELPPFEEEPEDKSDSEQNPPDNKKDH